MAIDFVACCDAAQACDGSGLGQAAVPQLLQEAAYRHVEIDITQPSAAAHG